MDATLRFEIDDLYSAYVACIDDGRFADWPEFFTEECVYRVVPRENFDRGLPLSTLAFESKGMLKDRVYGVTQTLFHAPYYQRHILGRPQLLEHRDGGVAVAAVDEAGLGVLEARLGGAGTVVAEPGGEVDRLGGLAMRAALGAAAHQAGPRPPAFGLRRAERMRHVMPLLGRRRGTKKPRRR